MWFFSFYRFYCSIVIAVIVTILLHASWWITIIISILVRSGILVIEHLIRRMMVNKLFMAHSSSFKQELGPYGIRMINRAEKDQQLRTSLAEVFVKSEKKLRKTVEQLEVMETLYKAGMRPDADTWQLHDLKLKYGRIQLERKEQKRDER